MKELIQLFTQIALLRRGPQDLPASLLLLTLTMIGYLVVNVVVSGLMPPLKGWEEHPAIDIIFTFAWYFVLLRVAGRSERNLGSRRYCRRRSSLPSGWCCASRTTRPGSSRSFSCG
jgi:hypothetical protein